MRTELIDYHEPMDILKDTHVFGEDGLNNGFLEGIPHYIFLLAYDSSVLDERMFFKRFEELREKHYGWIIGLPNCLFWCTHVDESPVIKSFLKINETPVVLILSTGNELERSYAYFSKKGRLELPVYRERRGRKIRCVTN